MRYSQTQKPPLGAQINFSHPLARGLVGFWLMNEGSGNRIYDLSGNGNNGTLVNMDGATGGWTPGRSGQALKFDGVDDYVTAGTSDILNTTSAVTVSAWMKTSYNFTSLANWFGSVGRVQNSTGFGYGIGIAGNYAGGNNNAFFHAGGTYSANGLLGTTPVNDNKWHHIVGKYDGTQSYIYVDGVLQNNAVKQNNLNNPGDPFDIGTDYNRGLFFPGLIDEVRIYNRALSAQEVWQLYTSPYAMFERQPYWMRYSGGTAIPVFMHHYLHNVRV